MQSRIYSADLSLLQNLNFLEIVSSTSALFLIYLGLPINFRTLAVVVDPPRLSMALIFSQSQGQEHSPTHLCIALLVG